MDLKGAEQMLKMMSSGNDTDAVMGLRGLQGLLKAQGLNLDQVIMAGLSVAPKVADAQKTVDQPSKPVASKVPVEISGMPQCQAPKPGHLEIIKPGSTQGEVVILPGASAAESDAIAANMKDALVAAAINKSRFKLKLVDIKNNRGEVVETVLQAEYEREGMTPIKVWVNVKGEVAALATVLRCAVANNFPELVA